MIYIEVCAEKNEYGKYRWTIYRKNEFDSEIIVDGLEDTFEQSYLFAYKAYKLFEAL